MKFPKVSLSPPNHLALSDKYDPTLIGKPTLYHLRHATSLACLIRGFQQGFYCCGTLKDVQNVMEGIPCKNSLRARTLNYSSQSRALVECKWAGKAGTQEKATDLLGL